MLGVLCVLALAAAAHTVDVPDALGDTVRAAKRSGVAVYLPETIPSPRRTLFPDVTARRGAYQLDLGLVEGCGGAGACFVASFTGEADGRFLARRRIRLHDGITGRFARSGCGASCSAPRVEWKVDGAKYTVAVKGVGRRAVKRAANSAIDAGQR